MAAIATKAKQEITKLISDVVDKYLQRASSTPSANSGNPFVLAILKDFEPILHRIHGLKTSMGNEMEKIAEIIAVDAWGKANVQRKFVVTVALPKNVFQRIDSIMSVLTSVKKHPNYPEEKKLIYSALQRPSKEIQEHTYELDLRLFDAERDSHYFLEMKGPDPNTTEVSGAKRRLLAALAFGMSKYTTERVDSVIGVYYNNKFPRPYRNPKMLNYFDPAGDMKVHEEFWNFLGKDDRTYFELLGLFEEYGAENKAKIWDGFSKLINLK